MDEALSGEGLGETARANRVAFLVDSQAYFTAAYEALLRARRSVLLLGWGFDPRTRLAPDGGAEPGEEDEIGKVLLRLTRERPDLDIRLLIWKSALPISATQDFFPHKARRWFENTPVRFHLDACLPLGACHHQKLLVIDDAIAFTGGGDFATDRWDSIAHRDEDNRRIHLNHEFHPPRHEVMIAVDGPAARTLGDLARARWRRATSEIAPRPPEADEDPWPPGLRPDRLDAPVVVARTEPRWRGHPAVSEIRNLTLASIAGARRLIYLENQYFTAPWLAEALAARLAEPHGPEVVIISTASAPSWFDRMTMDRARALIIRRLRAADVFGRLHVYCPYTAGGRPIIVHSKVAIIDDDIVRVGSANLNNRSFGFDTELELAVLGSYAESRPSTRRLLGSLVGHFLSRDADSVVRAIETRRSLGAAIEALNRNGRLRPIPEPTPGPLQRFVTEFHLGDPISREDAFRLLLRRKLIHRSVNEIAAEAGVMRFIRSDRNRQSEEGGPTPPLSSA